MIRQDNFLSRTFPPLVLFVVVLLGWEFAVRFFSVPQFLLPAPSLILDRIWEARASLANDIFVTMTSAVAGFILGTLVAVTLAVVFLYSKAAERAILPWTLIIRTIPVVALAPLLTIWLGFGIAPKIAIAAIISFFPILINVHRGLASVSRELGELLHVIDASRIQSLINVRLYTSLPYAFAAMKVSSGLAVVGAIVAEFTGANRGIGTLIVVAGYQQDATMLFAGIGVSAIATILFYYVIVLFEHFCLYWPGAQVE